MVNYFSKKNCGAVQGNETSPLLVWNQWCNLSVSAKTQETSLTTKACKKFIYLLLSYIFCAGRWLYIIFNKWCQHVLLNGTFPFHRQSYRAVDKLKTYYCCSILPFLLLLTFEIELIWQGPKHNYFYPYNITIVVWLTEWT